MNVIGTGLLVGRSTQKKSETLERKIGCSARRRADVFKTHLCFPINKIHTNFLRVCKAFYHQGSAIFYGRTEFIIFNSRSEVYLSEILDPDQRNCDYEHEEKLRLRVANLFNHANAKNKKNLSSRFELSQFLHKIGPRNAALIQNVVLAGRGINKTLLSGPTLRFGTWDIWWTSKVLNMTTMMHLDTTILSQLCPNLRKLTFHPSRAWRGDPDMENEFYGSLNRVVERLPLLEELKLGYFDGWFRSEFERFEWGTSLEVLTFVETQGDCSQCWS